MYLFLNYVTYSHVYMHSTLGIFVFKSLKNPENNDYSDIVE